MVYFVIPLVFVILGYLLAFLILYPVTSPFLSLFNMIIGDKPPTFSLEVKNSYVTNEFKNEFSVDINDVTIPNYEEIFAKIIIENADINCDLFYGDSKLALNNGVGLYIGSKLPGFSSTILIAGHNHTYFKNLKNVELGDIVEIKTNYGDYKYKVFDISVKKANDKTAFDLSSDEENLVLYTCYPFGSIGLTPERYFIYGEKISGPAVMDNN